MLKDTGFAEGYIEGFLDNDTCPGAEAAREHFSTILSAMASHRQQAYAQPSLIKPIVIPEKKARRTHAAFLLLTHPEYLDAVFLRVQTGDLTFNIGAVYQINGDIFLETPTRSVPLSTLVLLDGVDYLNENRQFIPTDRSDGLDRIKG